MILAAIDIGSNAARLQVSRVIIYSNETQFKKIEYLRFPLQLGSDVFTLGFISETKAEQFLKLMQTFKLLIELYQVDDYMICATSAMRDAKNGQKIIKDVYQKTGLKIEIISGLREASLINKVIISKIGQEPVLHIDVGGGSTELNLYTKGKKIATESFEIGSIRKLSIEDSPKFWKSMEEWIKYNTKNLHGRLKAIGTGGNITKLYDLVGKKAEMKLSLRKIKEMRTMLNNNSFEDNMRFYNLNPDRADVIIPASDIYINAMIWSKATSILVPEIGLKDGIMQSLFEKVIRN
ncbi:MAG: phosphatase [Thermodesulfobacteriota bacterium]